MTSMDLHFSSENQGWQTPDEVLSVVRQVSWDGCIKLDPCTVPENPTGAAFIFVPPVFLHLPANALKDGLKQAWSVGCGGLTFVNPPYGRECSSWVEKAIMETRHGHPIITLTAARPDTRWGQALMRASVAQCWWAGRIKFRGAPHAAPFPSVFTLLSGDAADRERFVAALGTRGTITQVAS